MLHSSPLQSPTPRLLPLCLPPHSVAPAQSSNTFGVPSALGQRLLSGAPGQTCWGLLGQTSLFRFLSCGLLISKEGPHQPFVGYIHLGPPAASLKGWASPSGQGSDNPLQWGRGEGLFWVLGYTGQGSKLSQARTPPLLSTWNLMRPVASAPGAIWGGSWQFGTPTPLPQPSSHLC